MQKVSFLILIPSSKGNFCGLADHASVLSALAQEKEGISSKHVFWWDKATLFSSLPVLAEYAPLSYSRIGMPLHILLLFALWRLRRRCIVLYFHEIPFSGHLDARRRVVLVMQRVFCIFLAMTVCKVAVNQVAAFAWLRRPLSKKHPVFLPTCSNVGEVDVVPMPDDRPFVVMVFGSPGKRQHAHALMHDQGGYSSIFGDDVRVVDIGEPLGHCIAVDPTVSCLGPLPAASVKAAMLKCRFGFFYSEPDQFSKSGVFAAYCSMGVVPVIAYKDAPVSSYYLTIDDFLKSDLIGERVLRVWSSCRRWARTHNSHTMTEAVLSMLGLA